MEFKLRINIALSEYEGKPYLSNYIFVNENQSMVFNGWLNNSIPMYSDLADILTIDENKKSDFINLCLEHAHGLKMNRITKIDVGDYSIKKDVEHNVYDNLINIVIDKRYE